MNSINLGATFAAGLTALSLAMPASAEMTLSFTDNGPNRGARAEATNWFAEELAKRTEGEIKMEIHWGGALLKAKAATKGIGDGAADMGFIIGVYNPSMHPGFLLADLPTQYADPWASTRALYELNTTNDVLKAEWDKLNLHFVTNITTGPIQMVCKDKSVTSVDDMAGLKVRGISVYGKVAKDLGAIPVKMSAYDTYQGLDTGLIDCTMFYSYAIPAFKLNEVATNVTLLDWGALMALGIVMNKDAWEAMTPEQQATLNELSSEWIDVYAKKLSDANATAITDMKAAGKITFDDFPDAQKEQLLSASKAYLTDWKEKAAKAGIDGDALVADYTAMLQRWDAEREAKGYPWTR
jgi:TRAP-type C4-dicarboxylate transport system substrate-binding protein